MSRWKRPEPLPGLLLLVGLVAGAGLALPALWPAPVPAPSLPVAPDPGPVARPPAAPAALAPGEAARRPPFSPTRRPPPAPEPPAPPKAGPPPPPDLALTGVLVAPGGAVAMVLDRAAGRTLSLRPGDRVRGWEVRAVSREGATLARDGETLSLAPARPGSQARPAPVPSPGTRTP